MSDAMDKAIASMDEFAANSVNETIAAGAKVLFDNPCQMSQIVADADKLGYADLLTLIKTILCNEMLHWPTDYNRVIAARQALAAAQMPGFEAAWNKYRSFIVGDK